MSVTFRWYLASSSLQEFQNQDWNGEEWDEEEWDEEEWDEEGWNGVWGGEASDAPITGN